MLMQIGLVDTPYKFFIECRKCKRADRIDELSDVVW